MSPPGIAEIEQLMRIIKKYSNRRLYDTSASRYVNLEELAGLIRAGEELKVVDASSGEELTRAVLLQVLLEGQGTASLFPVGLLHRLVRYSSDQPYHRMFIQQASIGLEMLDAQMMRFERQFGWLKPEAPPPETGAPAEAPPEEAPAPEPAPAKDAELDALRARLAALESRLKG